MNPFARDAAPYPASPHRVAGFVLLGPRFDQALTYAAAMHREQSRKASPVPYLAHLLGVTSLVLEYGGDEGQAIAALLHDTLEDCPGDHASVIEEQFGPEVRAMVEACSDFDTSVAGEKPPWRTRKEGYIGHLAGLGPGHRALLVSACDKLHNARSILADLREHGLTLWDRFNAPAADQLWYYRGLVEAFGRVLGGPVCAELERTVEAIAELDRALRME